MNRITPTDVKSASSRKMTDQTTMSRVNMPMKMDHSLNPVSAHCTSIVVLSRRVKKRNMRYTFSIILAWWVMLNQSSESKIALKKMLKTP